MILEQLADSPELIPAKAVERQRMGRTVLFDGLAGGSRALVAAGLYRRAGGHVLLAAGTEEEAESLYHELPYYGVPADSLFYYPMSLNHSYGETGPDLTGIGERLAALYALAENSSRVMVVAPVNALLQKTMPREELLSGVIALAAGDREDVDRVTDKLSALGYSRSEICDHHGVFCRRGDILDVFPSGSEYPVRIYFDWDEITSLRYFDPENQRSIEDTDRVRLLPVREVIAGRIPAGAVARLREDARVTADRLGHNAGPRMLRSLEGDLERLSDGRYFDLLEYYLPYVYPETTLLDYMTGNWLLVLSEPSSADDTLDRRLGKIASKLAAAEQNGFFVSDRTGYLADSEILLRRLSSGAGFLLAEHGADCRWLKPADYTVKTDAEDNLSYTGRMGELMKAVERRKERGYRIALATTRISRMRELLPDYGVEETDSFMLQRAILDKGCLIKSARIWIITDNDMFGTQKVQKVRRFAKDSAAISSYGDLKPGDIVVHVENGIAKYGGVSYRTALGMTVETFELEFAKGAKMYVPTDQIQLIRKYTGSDGTPALSKLGTSDWEKKKTRARNRAAEVARDLVELYAYRETLPGYAYGKDDKLMEELEESFPYRETASQFRAIEDVKADLESRKPMDRLVCGDVGFGKTEVAIRAAFKAVCNRRQVAVLAPTTVLVRQHFASFSERLAPFPVSIAQLSRFQTREEQKKVLAGIRDGSVNVVIGTHRLLSKDVEFADLGLLIIDEEQRFGVRHKEKLRQLRRNIDTLALSATPIPRTLHMALSGIRGLSNIVDAPEGRMPIRTVVREYDENMAAEAARRELERGGQVFFIHNRVEDIDEVCSRLEELLPDAAIDIAHGQMNEGDLEEVMVDFYEGRLDMLVATTIIENGLDVPNANTIIIDCSESLGLAQLYQLRGRVGRSTRQAYAYLFYRNSFTEAGQKRLESLREFSELGSGFRIAQRDLEIRGAGNVLGESQHGCIEAVGFDLYCQMVSQEIDRLRGIRDEAEELPPVGIAVSAYIPKSYIEADGPRLLIYNRLASCTAEETRRDIREELEDRFGKMPPETENLLRILGLRILCREKGVARIVSAAGGCRAVLADTLLTPKCREALSRKYPDLRFTEDSIVFATDKHDVIDRAEAVVQLAPAVRAAAARSRQEL
ncbi:MAG: transcription-repair coupling factor [Abditibacteriota bacterium]|nr:transcription-repair coupling factor [Abditibacteriota bacterium]